MHILILGGNSIKNKTWAYEVEAALKSLDDSDSSADSHSRVAVSTQVHEYAHWQSGEAWIDLERELVDVTAKIKAHVAPGDNITPDEYIIVGKSMGAVLAAKGLAEHKLHPKACVLIGTPLTDISRHPEILFKQWLKAADCNLIFVQNRDDPLGSAESLREYLSGSRLADCQFIELPDDTHDYSDTAALRRAVKMAA